MLKNVTDTIFYIGADDRDIDLFEGQYIVPNGIAYNSYLIRDEKTAVMDTIDARKTEEWLANLEEALENRKPDYLIVQHMEPDHAASIEAFLRRYPETTVVGNSKTFTMIAGFFPGLSLAHRLEVKNLDTLSLGSHTLTFAFAPMVHWPEVMMTYDALDKALFSADGFGKFGALDHDEPWEDEARRYYIGIVGKYGKQVQNILKVAAGLDIRIICPLHGPVLTENLAHHIGLYDTWARYEPETRGVCICYTSIYGHTKAAAELLHDELRKAGVAEIRVHDLARCDVHEAVADAFRFDRLALATTTYNGEVFPYMAAFLRKLTERCFQNRLVGLMENGSWAPMANKIMKEHFAKSKDIRFAENDVTILSALNEKSAAQVRALAKELANA